MGWRDARETCIEWSFSVLVSCLVVTGWRGGWVVLDACLLTSQPLLSAGASLGGGCAVFVALAALQPWLHGAVRRRSARAWWAADALFTYAGFWSSVLVWRGVWQLWDHALGVGLVAGLPDEELARGGWACHHVGVGGLLLCDASRSLNAAPMLWAKDSASPLFGARASPGWRQLRSVRRFGQAPAALSRREWRATTGLPPAADSTVAMPPRTCAGEPVV